MTAISIAIAITMTRTRKGKDRGKNSLTTLSVHAGMIMITVAGISMKVTTIIIAIMTNNNEISQSLQSETPLIDCCSKLTNCELSHAIQLMKLLGRSVRH